MGDMGDAVADTSPAQLSAGDPSSPRCSISAVKRTPRTASGVDGALCPMERGARTAVCVEVGVGDILCPESAAADSSKLDSARG